ncbi:hypothetical protein N7454_006369 [Penicillium verhagenii]|nr:hypothetical protein N7454_006369 [Penicillium verhagenii]
MSATESSKSPGLRAEQRPPAPRTPNPSRTPRRLADLPTAPHGTSNEEATTARDECGGEENGLQATREKSIKLPKSRFELHNIYIPSCSQSAPLEGQMEELSISGPNTPVPQGPTEIHTPARPHSLKKTIRTLNSAPTPAATQSMSEESSGPSSEKELPEVPGDSDPESKQPRKAEGSQEESDSQPEIPSIMGQFQDPARITDQEQIMSPRLELATQNYFPPRKSSLDHIQSPVTWTLRSLSSSASCTVAYNHIFS